MYFGRMEKSRVAEIATIILVLIFSLQVQGQADHTLVYDCSKYTFHMASKTTKVKWEESRRLCKEVGSDLVSIESKEEWIVLKNAIQNLTANEYLIGLRKDKHSGRWIWLNNNSSMNTSRGKSPWAPAQPSGDGQCVEMLKDYNEYYGLFNDLPCRIARGGYICEGPIRCIDNKGLNPCSSNPCQNGGSCDDKGDGTYGCTCQRGFTGDNCKEPLDPCSLNPCQNGGSCDDKGDGTYSCTCQRGFTGDVCQEPWDPCSSKPCQNGGSCDNKGDGTYGCSCQGGFTGDNCQEPVDPCFSNPCQNGGSCDDKGDGTYGCTCQRGFTGDNCTERLDPCSSKPCQNGGRCDDKGDGTYGCTCQSGFTGDNCTEPVDPCSSNPCQNGGSCDDKGDGTYGCTCQRGFTGDNCTERLDPCSSKPCQNGGRCDDKGDGTYGCTCQSGFTGDNCTEPVDPCSSSPCQNGGSCDDKGDGTYGCTCQRGFTGDNCTERLDPCSSKPCQNGGRCDDKGDGTYGCTCQSGFTGNNCTEPLEPCSSNPCQNGGRCDDRGDGTYSCTCQRGFTGENCTDPLDPCSSNPCQNGGSCDDKGNGTYGCSCQGGFTGDNCTELFDPCSSNPCLNGGRCDDKGDGTYGCTCESEFTGTNCSEPLNPCSPNPCQNGGSCDDKGDGTYGCSCQSGFTGENCTEPLNPCSPNPCQNGGSCDDNGDRTYGCNCQSGFTGDNCSEPLDPCFSNPCQNGGSCDDKGDGTYGCSCQSGFTGENCTKPLNPCSPNPCQNGGSCANKGYGTYGCSCQSGFTGNNCTEPLDPCSPNPCQNGGRCDDKGDGTYACSCQRGFTGDNCTEALDPCSSKPCLNGGKCDNKGDGTYGCTCQSGFTGDNCSEPLDPCSSNPCQNGGNCVDKGDGTYGCSCQSGFTGKNCQKLDCSAHPCRNGGTCLDLAERPICKCPSEFTGTVCQGKTPRIIQDPKDAVRMAGGKVTFCCEAEGEPASTFSWLHNEVPMKNQVGKTLRLTSLSIAADGLYKCRAINGYGKAVSSEAKLTVITGGGADSCDQNPLSKVVSLPPGCTEDSSKSNKVNVGTCSYEECTKRGQGDSGSCGGGEDKTRRCCSPMSQPVNSPVTCINGIKFNIEKVRGCRCSLCAVPDIIVRGRVVDEDGNPLLMGEIAVQGDKNKYFTDLSGYFRFTVKSGTKRLVLNFKDPFGSLQETTKAFDLHAGQVSFYTIMLQKKPSAIKFAATQKQKIPLSAPSKPDFAAVDIPENAFVTADGDVYEGEITANVGVIDPRTEANMAAAPGDFSAIDDNGEEVMLGTAGMLRQSFTDSSGKELILDRNITFRIDADMVDVPDGVTVYQYYLSKETGRWVKFGVFRTEEGEVQESVGRTKRQGRRKFFVGDITPNVPYNAINCDYPQVVTAVRVLAPAGAVVTRIGLSNNGQSFTNYHQETVPSNGILCMRSPRDMPTIMQAELNGAPLLPQQPNNFPPVVNPQIIDRNSPSSPIQSFRFTSSAGSSRGPVYPYPQRRRCQQRVAGDLAFQFQQAGQAATFQWQNARINNPRSPRFWNALFPNVCFIKALVTGSDTVIYAKSTGKARGQPQLDYGYTAERSTRLRAGNEGVACLEYRCNRGSATAYQAHLQLITLTGRCQITGLNVVLQRAQGRCAVSPDADSSQENNFCIPDLNGGAAGLYRGNQGLARFRCLTGDNNYNGGRPNPTNVNPTVRLTCS